MTQRNDQDQEFTAAVFFRQAASFFGASSFSVRPTGTGVEGETPAAATSNDTGVTGSTSAEVVLSPKTVTLTLTAVVVDVTEANGYGGTKILNFVDGSLVTILAAIVDLTYTKDGTGYITTSDLTSGVGTAVASNATLSGAMVDVLAIQTMAADVLAPTLNLGLAKADPVAQTTSTDSLFLNVAGATESSEDADVTVSGTITVTLIDHGVV